MSTQIIRKQIVISDDTRAFLMKTFNCTHKHVWAAITFRANSDSAKRIRKLAMQRGGILIDGNVPKTEPTYDTANRIMTQPFSDKISIMANFANGIVRLFNDNVIIEEWTNPSLEEFVQLQQRAQKLANSHL